MKVLIIYDKKNPHQAIRMIMGVQACGPSIELDIIDDPLRCNTTYISQNYDYILVEASVDTDLSFLKKKTDKIILFDTEDKPSWFNPKLGYESLKDKALAYAKYNYQGTVNRDGLQFIGAPQIDYINKGMSLAKACSSFIYNNNITAHIFFICGPTYMTDYTPLNKISKFNNVTPIVKRPPGTGLPQETDWLYNQRLEWMEDISNSKSLKILDMGFHFNTDIHRKDPLSIEYHTDLFGKVERYSAKFYDTTSYYTGFLRCEVGLCPAGVARSSYRLIELMALGRTIISTNTEGYKYLYNPIVIYEVPDETNVVNHIFPFINNQKLLEYNRPNHEIFLNLTPEKMWTDFISQIK